MNEFKFKVLIEEITNPPQPIDLLNSLKNRPYSFFLDSSSSHEKFGRFSFLGCEPLLVFKSKRDLVTLEWENGKIDSFRANPFFALRDIFKKYNILTENKEIPFISGGVGYFSYDLKNFIEDLPDETSDDLNLPDCIFGFYDVVIIYDHLKKRSYIASSGLPETRDVAKNTNRKIERMKEFKNRISEARADDKATFYLTDRYLGKNSVLSPSLKSNFSKASYMRAIEKAKLYIKKGDIYQVNLSQRFEADLNMGPMELYRRLRAFSPAPFSSYLDFKDLKILSSSPERFLFKKKGYIQTRPIKGTRPRGQNKSFDSSLERELVRSAKDRAEHIMIVDLERNDLGRICEYGTVSWNEPIILERYSTVFHLVSTVSGQLRKDIDPIDCLLATFPGGSITGAPKIRAMEIIEELEPVKRSVYTGAVGYISFDGNMDSSIVIRTFVVKDGRVYFHVGGGIVADSIPVKEYEETLHKAKGLIKALGINTKSVCRNPKQYQWKN